MTLMLLLSIDSMYCHFMAFQSQALVSSTHRQLLEGFMYQWMPLMIPLVSAVVLAPLSARLLEKLRIIFKDQIFFHRAYRKLPRFRGWTLVKLILLVGIVDALIFVYNKELIHGFISAVRDILLGCGVPAKLLYQPFLPMAITHIPILDSALVFPSPQLALYSLAVGILIIVILPRLDLLPRAMVVYLVLLALLNSASAIFFLLIPQRFPYDISDFSMLYMGTQVGMWLLIPFVLAAVLAPLPAHFLEKLLVIFLTIIYSITFGVVRYAALLFLLNKVTVLYMAAMFFAMGPLIDFFYVVAFYSIYVNVLALRLKRSQEIWRWLF